MRLPKRLLKKRAETSSARVVVVGLRNPGPGYQGTRHNIGFEVLSRVADRAGARLGRAPARVPAQVVSLGSAVLASPVTYMNDSGRAVRAILDYWRVAPADLLVIHDDIDLAFGRLRVQVGGGSGGHNGIRSIDRALGTPDYSRLKVGVGRPPGTMDPADYVLQRFSKTEREEIDVLIEDAADVVDAWLEDRSRAQEMAAHRGRDA
ncbi:MAG TPA: aminoacyl-tRNA hydrolase [Acidimicrobiia bacterium]